MAAATTEQLDGMRQWLAAGFGPDAWEHISGRLEKSDDVALLRGTPEEIEQFDLLLRQ